MSKSSIKSSIKQDLIQYDEAIKSEIDLAAQLEMQKRFTSLNIEEILSMNDLFIQQVDKIFKTNMNDVSQYFANNMKLAHPPSIECTKSLIINSFCIFIPKECLMNEIANDHLIGVLIITDFYLNQNQIEFLRNQYIEDKKQIRLELDDTLVNLIYTYQHQDLIYKLSNSILYLSKSHIENELNELSYFKLNLKWHLIENFKPSTFSNLINLKHLDISCNIEELDVDCLNSLENLEELYLNGCGIKLFKQNSLKSLTNLKRVILNGNKINIFNEKTLQGIEKAYELNLDSCGIQLITPFSFGNFKNLKILTLSGNHFKDGLLEANIFNGLSNIEIIYLNYCGIEFIDENAFENLKRLKKLSLSANKLERVGKVFKDLESLHELVLTHSDIKFIENGAFESLNNLKILNLWSNAIEHLTNETFKGLERLEELILRDNKLETFEANTFNQLIHLKHLQLVQNNLNSIEINAFNGLRLNTLTIDNGVLKKMNLEEFKKFYDLKNSTQIYINYSKLN